MKTYKISIVFLMLFIAGYGNAQTFKAEYLYDANGNRILAKVIYLNATLKSEALSLEQVFSETAIDTTDLPKEGWGKGEQISFSGYSVSIFPNPVQSSLLVDVKGPNSNNVDNQMYSLQLFDLQGHLLINKSNLQLSNYIHFTDKPNGVYILKLRINNNYKEYKIIKN